MEERSKVWIERGREQTGREEQRMDRKRKRAELEFLKSLWGLGTEEE